MLTTKMDAGTKPLIHNFMKLEKCMNHMFKKTLVAIALASVSSGAMAAKVGAAKATTGATNLTSYVASSEFLDATTAEGLQVYVGNVPVTALLPAQTGTAPGNDNAIRVVLETNYRIGDRLVLDFGANGGYVTGSAPDSLVIGAQAANTSYSSAVAAGAAIRGVTLGKLSDANGVVTYRVTELSTDANTAPTTGLKVDFEGLRFDSSVVKANGGIKVKYSAFDVQTNERIDGTATPVEGTVMTVRQQDALAFTSAQRFDAIVNVLQPLPSTAVRKEFVFPVVAGTANNATAVDALAGGAFTIADASAVSPVDAAYSASLAGVRYSVAGDFGFLRTNAAVNTAITEGCTGLSAGEYTLSRVSFSCTAAAATFAFARPAVASINPINRTTFDLSAVAQYKTVPAASEAVSSTLPTVNWGNWRYNGSVVKVPYMPYRTEGSVIGQIINVTNWGDRDGYISLQYWTESGKTGFVPLNVLAKRGAVTNIASETLVALQNELAFTGPLARIALEYTISVPVDTSGAESVEIYSAYNNGNDRGLVINSSNKTSGKFTGQ